MSERALLTLALLLGAAAGPLRAQEIERLRRHEAELSRRLATLEAEAATRDSSRFSGQARRVQTVGPLHVALPDWVDDEAVRGLTGLVADRRARYGAALDSLLTDTLVIWADTSLRGQDGYTPLEWRLGALSSRSNIALDRLSDPDWLQWTAGTALDQWALRLLDPALVQWLGAAGSIRSDGGPPDGIIRDLIRSPSARGRRCVAGAIEECRLLLELGDGASPRVDAYDPSDLPALAKEIWVGRTIPGRARCLSDNDPTACRAFFGRAGIVPLTPATEQVRQGLFIYALAAGGEGAWLRLQHAAGRPVPEQLVAAAGTPLDDLLQGWQRDLQTRRRTTDAGLVPNLLLALGWLVAGTLIFAWRYRWRSV